MTNDHDFRKLYSDDGVLMGFGNEQAAEVWESTRPHLAHSVRRDVESFYAIRKLDGDKTLMGEFSWLMCDGPDDWMIADEHDEGEFEIVLMTITPIARKTLPLPNCAECGNDGPRHGAILTPHPTEEGLMICVECAELGGEAGGA